MIASFLLTLSFFAQADNVQTSLGNVIAVERVYDLDLETLTDALNRDPKPRRERVAHVPVYPNTTLVWVNDVGYEPCQIFLHEKLTISYCAQANGYFASVSAPLGAVVSRSEASSALSATIVDAKKHKFYATVLIPSN